MEHKQLSRLSRFVAGAALAGVALSTMAASPVVASVSYSNAGSASTTITCSQIMHQMTINMRINPRTGLSSQSVTYRLFIEPNGAASGGWTNWAPSLRAPISFTRTSPMPAGSYFTVYVQYAWYNNGWLYGGEWISSYAHAGEYGYTRQYDSCMT